MIVHVAPARTILDQANTKAAAKVAGPLPGSKEGFLPKFSSVN